MLKLSNEKVGTPNKRVIDPHKEFIDGLHDRKVDHNSRMITQSLFMRSSNVPTDRNCYHKNYLQYLCKCWADHLGAVITPDIIWNMLLCELSQLVKANPEKYRHLFSETKEKQTIIIVTSELVVMPLDRLIDSLKGLVPTDSSAFLPEFSTTSPSSRHASYAAFCDMCSPYYNYLMYLCNIPIIDVRGTKKDWQSLLDCWTKIDQAFDSEKEYFFKVSKVLQSIIDNLNNADFWRGMFRLDRCGSGHQSEVRGWITDLYHKVLNVSYPENFSQHLSLVDYRQLDTKTDYQMQVGLFSSSMEGDLLVPDFGNFVFEKCEKISESYAEGEAYTIKPMERFLEKIEINK